MYTHTHSHISVYKHKYTIYTRLDRSCLKLWGEGEKNRYGWWMVSQTLVVEGSKRERKERNSKLCFAAM